MMDDWGSVWGEELPKPLAGLSTAPNIAEFKNRTAGIHGFDPLNGNSPWTNDDVPSVNGPDDKPRRSRVDIDDLDAHILSEQQTVKEEEDDDYGDFVWGEEQGQEHEADREANAISFSRSLTPKISKPRSLLNETSQNNESYPEETEEDSSEFPEPKQMVDTDELVTNLPEDVVFESKESRTPPNSGNDTYLESASSSIDGGAVGSVDAHLSDVRGAQDSNHNDSIFKTEEDDDFGEFEDTEEPQIAGFIVDLPKVTSFGDAQPLQNDDFKSKPRFSVDLSHINQIFPVTSDEQTPLSDIPDETISSTSNRKVWYRITRKETMREENFADESNYVKIRWNDSKVRRDVNKRVEKWIGEDRSLRGFGFGFGLHSGARARNIFKWSENSKDVSSGMGRSRSQTTASGPAPLLLGSRHRHHQSLAPGHFPPPESIKPPQSFPRNLGSSSSNNTNLRMDQQPRSSDNINGRTGEMAASKRDSSTTPDRHSQSPFIPENSGSQIQSPLRAPANHGRATSVGLRKSMPFHSKQGRTTQSVDLSALQPLRAATAQDRAPSPLLESTLGRPSLGRLPPPSRPSIPHLTSQNLVTKTQDSPVYHSEISSVLPNEQIRHLRGPSIQLLTSLEDKFQGLPRETSTAGRPSSDLAELVESPITATTEQSNSSHISPPNSPMTSLPSTSSPVSFVETGSNGNMKPVPHNLVLSRGPDGKSKKALSPIGQTAEHPRSSFSTENRATEKTRRDEEEDRIVRSIIAGLPDLSYMLK
ncbi:hypothetical protein L228DRAFT_25256 [Xylona heveae TC161]|uniref:Uncharacterized protein n=1 Tax=Xylona heveae (strain CBS 132557 / TC161) TaxID=1328760 RepID=A0A165ACU4_XYLHT|nr:hypothetical protein L228DRAFT_25256 [Xylona heveae TC161]KZF20266.1 hypothetical protein L228DRAFT_25256 [Xylona heveae TC161]